MTTAASATQRQASEYVKGDRGAVYGPPLVNHQRIADIWSVILGTKVTPEQAVLCMLGVKLARLVQTVDHKDTIVDIHGYCDVLEAVNEAQRLLDPEDKPFVAAKDHVPEPEFGTYKAKITWHRPVLEPGEVRLGEPGHTKGYPVSPENAPSITFPDGSKDMTFEEAVGTAPPVDYFTGPKGEFKDPTKDSPYAPLPRRNPCGQ